MKYDYEEMWHQLRDQLKRTRDTGFREKTLYALTMMETIEEEFREQHENEMPKNNTKI